MTRPEVPSDDEVVATLGAFADGRADAVQLCAALMNKGHPRQESQLAIQRAAERGKVFLDDDFMLSVPQEAAAA